VSSKRVSAGSRSMLPQIGSFKIFGSDEIGLPLVRRFVSGESQIQTSLFKSVDRRGASAWILFMRARHSGPRNGKGAVPLSFSQLHLGSPFPS
jgi:hypothetical protein